MSAAEAKRGGIELRTKFLAAGVGEFLEVEHDFAHPVGAFARLLDQLVDIVEQVVEVEFLFFSFSSTSWAWAFSSSPFSTSPSRPL